MATKFRKYHRFDTTKAQYGVEHRIEDEAGNYYGTFKTSLFDPFNKYLKVETERFERECAKDEKNLGQFKDIFAFIQLCMKDWKDVLDEDGSEVPYSPDEAFDLFTDEDNAYLVNRLIAETRDVSNYPTDPVAKKDEALGKSKRTSTGSTKED